MPTKVYVGVPNTGAIHASVSECLLGMLTRAYAGRHGDLELKFDHRIAKPIDNCRNQMAKAVLEGGWDYLVMIDSDNPPLRDPLELIQHDKDIVICPTPIWDQQIYARGMGHNPVKSNVFDDMPETDGWTEHRMGGMFEQCDAGGTGCIVIARRVLEAVRPAFVREWDQEGIVRRGSDLLFCRRAKDAGFEIWVSYEHYCHHFKTVDLLAVHNVLEVRDIKHATRKQINTPEYWDGRADRPDRRIAPHNAIVARVESMVKERNLRVLDFGCGRGELLERLASIPGVTAVGLDFSPAQVEVCRARGLTAYTGSTPSAMIADPWFDLIVCTEVLEHLDDDEGTIQHLMQFTGHLLYTVPFNCLPPGLEPEHRRVYTEGYCRRITPHYRGIEYLWSGDMMSGAHADYLLVEAKKETKSSDLRGVGAPGLAAAARGDD